jgi:hypothetical protein
LDKNRFVDVTLYDLNFPVTYDQLCMVRNLLNTAIDASNDPDERIELRSFLYSLYAVQMESGRTFGAVIHMNRQAA